MKYYNISHFNGPRLADELVIYDTGEKTSTNAYGLEAVVAKGVITKIGSNDNIIPDGGYVISGHGKDRNPQGNGDQQREPEYMKLDHPTAWCARDEILHQWIPAPEYMHKKGSKSDHHQKE